MKKKFALAFVLTVFLFGFTSCSKKEQTVVAESDQPTEFELWTFVEAHGSFYSQMAELWNEENPEDQISLKVTVLPNSDMHNKLQMALQSGYGAPDICDVHVRSFPNLLKGEPQIENFNSDVTPYLDQVVKSRLDLYSKDGNYYGIPTHVGASVMYYNTELLNQAGIDYTEIKTWEDYIAAGLSLKEKTGKYMNTAEAIRVNMLSAYLGQQEGDFVKSDGTPDFLTDELFNAIDIQKKMLDLEISAVSPGGKPDSEECYGWIDSGEVASFAFPMWFMSRFTDYMPNLEGKIAIAPMPVFTSGMDRSAGVGGTGTIVTKDSVNPDLAKKWLVWAKLSEQGGLKIWENLGFDPVNTNSWETISQQKDSDNKYLKYFVNNPFDILLEIKDEINLIKSVAATPEINSIFGNEVLLAIFENDQDIRQVLEEAQEQIMNKMN